MHHQSNMTFGQVLQLPHYRNEVKGYLEKLDKKKPPTQILANDTQVINPFPQTVRRAATRGYAKIGQQSLQVTYDTGSGISVISRPLAQKLRLRMTTPKKMDVVTLGGSRNAVTGVINNAPLCILMLKYLSMNFK
jgi:hypothetical protein